MLGVRGDTCSCVFSLCVWLWMEIWGVLPGCFISPLMRGTSTDTTGASHRLLLLLRSPALVQIVSIAMLRGKHQLTRVSPGPHSPQTPARPEGRGSSPSCCGRSRSPRQSSSWPFPSPHPEIDWKQKTPERDRDRAESVRKCLCSTDYCCSWINVGTCTLLNPMPLWLK